MKRRLKMVKKYHTLNNNGPFQDNAVSLLSLITLEERLKEEPAYG